MGNLHTITQIKPRSIGGDGAAIRIRDASVEHVRKFLADTRNQSFYTYFSAEGADVIVPNLAGRDVHLGVLQGNYVLIQSGGKMWCGYENFANHIHQLAPHLEDVLFYVRDEENYLDEFELLNGECRYTRVSEGYSHTASDVIHHVASRGMLTIPDLTFQINVSCFNSLNEFTTAVRKGLSGSEPAHEAADNENEFASIMHKTFGEMGIVWSSECRGETADNWIELDEYKTSNEFQYQISFIFKRNVNATQEDFDKQINLVTMLRMMLFDARCLKFEFNSYLEEFI